MLHAFYRFDPVIQLPDPGGASLDGYNFQAVIMVQMYMLGGQDFLVIVMLYGGNGIG